MTCSVYILYSKTAKRYYIGSSEDPERRLRQHNDPEYHGSRTTKVWPGPWVIVWQQELPDRAQAMQLERKIKKQGAKRFLERQAQR